jgi:hypothetical protein
MRPAALQQQAPFVAGVHFWHWLPTSSMCFVHQLYALQQAVKLLLPSLCVT